MPARSPASPSSTREQAERVVDRAVAALRAGHEPAAGELVRELRDALGERAEAARGHAACARSGRRPTRPGRRDHDQVGPEAAQDRRDDLVEREQVAAVGRRGGQRHVDRASLRAGAARGAERAGVGGVPVLLVQGDRQDVVAVPEDPLGAVGDVHVPVDDRDALDAARAGVLDAARHVVQVRRRDRAVGLGVVARRARVHERAPDVAVEHGVDRGQHAADRQPGRLPGARRDRRVLAVPRAARRGGAQPLEVGLGVDREQRLLRSRPGLDGHERRAERAALHELVRLRGQRRLGDVGLPSVSSRPAISIVGGGGSWSRTRGEYA